MLAIRRARFARVDRNRWTAIGLEAYIRFVRNGALFGLATLGVGLALSAVAHAEPDNRPGDRFFFGLGLGTVSGPTDRFVRPAAPDGVAFSYETWYWPDDYFGFGLDLHLNRLSDADTTITSVDLGVPIWVGVPLRWIQPYAGVWLGLDRTYFDSPTTANTTTGFRPAVHPLAGINCYLGRNLRLYLQWQSLGLRDPSCPEGAPAGSDCGANAYAQEVLFGVRGSPDWFHDKRGRTKFQIIYWSALTTAILWGLVMWEE